MMESALFRLNTLTTSDGLCDNQDLEEPVGPVSPSVYYYPRNYVVGTSFCPYVPLSLLFSCYSTRMPQCPCCSLEPLKVCWLCQHP